MKNLLMLFCLVYLASSPAFSQKSDPGKVHKRCKDDSLDVNQSIGRISWVFRCAEKQVRQYYSQLGYPENDPYEDVMFELRHAWLLNARGKVKPRPSYPTFTKDDLVTGWQAPVADDPHCRVKVPANFKIGATCMASCYTPEERVLYSSGLVPIQEAFQEQLQGLMTVSGHSTLNSIDLEPSKVRFYVESIRETDHKILVFQMASGGVLQVTPNHTLVDGNGYIKEAQNFTTGSYLVKSNGEKDLIESIDTIDYFGKVYNVEPSTDSLKGNLIVAEGYLSGSNWYQNDGYNHINKRILREALPKELVTQ